jgi:hypothetical protein
MVTTDYGLARVIHRGDDLRVWKTPHGIPARISATCKVSMLGAQKKIAMKPEMRMRQAMTVYLYPNRSDTIPLTVVSST